MYDDLTIPDFLNRRLGRVVKAQEIRPTQYTPPPPPTSPASDNYRYIPSFYRSAEAVENETAEFVARDGEKARIYLDTKLPMGSGKHRRYCRVSLGSHDVTIIKKGWKHVRFAFAGHRRAVCVSRELWNQIVKED